MSLRSALSVNWSEVIRQAIASRIREEELKRSRRSPFDKEELAEAVKITDAIRSKHTAGEKGGWSSVEEIRKWRDTRK